MSTAPFIDGTVRLEAWTMEEHHADRTAVSFSALSKLGVVDEDGEGLNPGAFWAHWTGDVEDAKSDAFAFGTLAHLAIYEPDRLLTECAVRPLKENGHLVPSNSRQFKSWAAENVGKRFVEPSDLAVITGMVAASMASPALQQLRRLPIVATEQSITWTDEDTGLRLKIRPDRILCRPDGTLVVEDLKTADDVSLAAFRRSCHRYRYFDRAAFYLDGLREYTKASTFATEPRAILLAMKKIRPYQVSVFEPRDSWIEEGRARNRALLMELARRFQTNNWLAPWEAEPMRI